VKAVANEIEVGLPPSHQRTDEEITRTVAEALISHTSVPPGRVKAQVSQGWVTLEGTSVRPFPTFVRTRMVGKTQRIPQ